ncbi:MAG: hypothetical protein E7Z92_06380 [Cyanobacteria bacterium SIG31]|nr:hypothetical protein [Cyanobacteria bacterium SIG31]
MKVSCVQKNKILRTISKTDKFRAIEKQLSKLQEEILNIEVSNIQAIYGIKINKSNYKKYKLG